MKPRFPRPLGLPLTRIYPKARIFLSNYPGRLHFKEMTSQQSAPHSISASDSLPSPPSLPSPLLSAQPEFEYPTPSPPTPGVHLNNPHPGSQTLILPFAAAITMPRITKPFNEKRSEIGKKVNIYEKQKSYTKNTRKVTRIGVRGTAKSGAKRNRGIEGIEGER